MWMPKVKKDHQEYTFLLSIFINSEKENDQAYTMLSTYTVKLFKSIQFSLYVSFIVFLLRSEKQQGGSSLAGMTFYLQEWDEVYEIEGLLRLEPELMARPNLMLQMLHAIYHGIDEAHFANDLLSFSEHVDAEKAPFHRDLGNNITMLMRLYISLAVQYIKVNPMRLGSV